MASTLPLQGSPTVNGYSRGAIAMHWILAVALSAQLALGWWMLDLPKTPPGLRAGWFNLHKSIGLSIALLVVLRLLWRVTHAAPHHVLLPRWQRRAARWAHGLLYACMVALPLSGYLGSTFTRYPVRYFGMVLPQWNYDWPAAKELMSSIHYALTWIFMLLLALHIAAALWHWFQRDGVMDRMGVPSLSRN